MMPRVMETCVSKAPRSAPTTVIKIFRKTRTVMLATGRLVELVALLDHRGRQTQNMNTARRAIGRADGIWYEVSFLDMEAQVMDEPPELPEVRPIVSKTQH